jgi:hypothetical protein
MRESLLIDLMNSYIWIKNKNSSSSFHQNNCYYHFISFTWIKYSNISLNNFNEIQNYLIRFKSLNVVKIK